MDVIGFGLANIDFVVPVDDEFLDRHGVGKGLEKAMSQLEFGRLRAELPAFDALPGGCVANTLCGLSAMGIPTKMYAKIGSDQFETLYRASFNDYMVNYDVSAADDESSQCAVLISPDGERSFAQIQAASLKLSSRDVDWAALEKAQIIYSEIYLEWFEDGKIAQRVYDTARRNKIPHILKIIDRDNAEKYHDTLHAACADGGLTLLVANQDNMPALTGTDKGRATIEALKKWPCPVIMTASKGGAYYIDGEEILHHEVEPITNPKNSSGAGDQFMAGFIAGMLDGKAVTDCLALGAATARQILMHNQPRPPLTTKQSIRF